MQHAMTTNCNQPTDAENLKYEGSIHPYAATMTEQLQQLQFKSGANMVAGATS
jgi:hypothetical protein